MRMAVHKGLLRQALLFIAFAYSLPAPAQYISGYIYLDDDQNGILEGLEGGLSGVRVLLYQDDGNGVFDGGDALVSTTNTDIQGIYTFSLSNELVVPIVAGNDDAEEASDGSMDRGSSDLELMRDGGDLQSAVGMRFRNITIPQGQAIQEAFITFTTDEASSEATNLTFYGHNTNNSGGFSNADNDITSRLATTAIVDWVGVPAWNIVGETHDTPNLASVVEEIVGRAGWTSGNSLSIIAAGTGQRVAESYNGSASQAPRLTIRYANPNALGNYFVVVNSADLQPGGTFTEPDASGVRSSSVTSFADSLVFQNIGYSGEAITCFLIPEAEDRLEIVNRESGNFQVVGQLNSPNGLVEAISLDINNNVLYAMDADELGVIDLQTGAFISRGNTVGNGNGSAGLVTFDDVDALSYDFNANVLYGVQANSGRKLIIINPLTGRLEQNAFGAGIDYLEIAGAGLLNEISDLTFAPSTGELYGINTNSSQSQIIQIDKNTGAATVISNITFGGSNLVDIEALAFTIYNTTTMYVTTGNIGATENAMYRVDVATGEATLIAGALTGDDYESCDCFFKAIPSLINYNPLPIQLLAFEGKMLDGMHALHWETASEIDFSHFELWASPDGLAFHPIARVDGKGHPNGGARYRWQSPERPKGLAYYRLKQVDADGSYAWSHVVALGSGRADGAEETPALLLYPNPAQAEVVFSLEGNLPSAQALAHAQVAIYDAQGRLVQAGPARMAMGQASFDATRLPPGLYWVRVLVGGQPFAAKLSVNR